MTETVYMIGAGTNMVVRHKDSGVRPPLATDLFQKLHRGLSEFEISGLFYRNEELYEYIRNYWKFTAEDLSHKAFDMEECFTLLEKQLEASDGQSADHTRLWAIRGQLLRLLADLLDGISSNQSPESKGLGPLAERIIKENAAVLTFNYDTLLEEAIQGNQEEWDPIYAYQAQFEEVDQGDDSGKYPAFRSVRFKQQQYSAPFLKLHGSLNWFRRHMGEDTGTAETAKLGNSHVKSISRQSMRAVYADILVDDEGDYFEPLIITPVLNKDVRQEIFSEVWYKAWEQLRECKKLIISGYSFPPSDFATRKLFLESFVGAQLEELVVINPDTSIVGRAKKLCHFRGAVSVCDSIEEYLD